MFGYFNATFGPSTSSCLAEFYRPSGTCICLMTLALRGHGTRAIQFKWSEVLEKLYVGLADRAGTQTASAEHARLFALEASAEFECVVWIPCHGRTLPECTGQLGTELGLTMDEPEKQSRRRVLETLRERRCLVVLDAPSDETCAALDFNGRSSVLTTTEPLEIQETPRTFHYARELVRNRRYAEAYTRRRGRGVDQHIQE
jgi:hypothetical protein